MERSLPLTIIMADVNGLKLVNDSLGHAVGDELLKKVAEVMIKGCGANDIIARLGGDEFVILLPIIEDIEDVILVAKKIVDAVAQPIKVAKTHLHITCSIGIAIYPEHGKDEKLLVINADMAMYHAKKSGKNQAKLFEEAMLH